MLSWFDANDATGVGVALAEDVASTVTIRMRQVEYSGSHHQDSKHLRQFLTKVKNDAGSLRLNLYKKAKLASSFKTKLLDNGIDSALAEHLTQLVLTQLANGQSAARPEPATLVRHKRPDFRKAEELLGAAYEFTKGGQHRKAADAFQELVQQWPGNADALAGLGAAQWHLGAYAEAERHFRRAIDVQPGHLDALRNLGIALHARGEYAEAEKILRRAIKSKPAFVRTQCALASVLIMQARVGEAETLLAKVLRSAPRDADALVCMARVLRLNGRFDEERNLLMRALESNRRLPSAWAGLVGNRKMTPADSDWLRGAEDVLTGALEPSEESELRFAVGKYCDDVGQYDKAFKSYQRANLVARRLAPKYDLHARETEVRDLIRGYSPQNVRNVSAAFAAASPVFVVGMMRSGTTLVEQILATHPRAAGAGELGFWADAYSRNEAAIRSGELSEAVRRQLGERYLQLLRSYGADSKVVIDKTNINADYLGLIHTVFPAARFICVERNPIDTCLSCYFLSLPPAHSYAFDLAELAHYYRLQRQLMRHWKSVLPSGVMLQVQYELLVSNKGEWIRKILDFAGLDWQPQCLNFSQTIRSVATASAWQVRQSMYSSSVGRWRHYEKHIGPLSSLTRST